MSIPCHLHHHSTADWLHNDSPVCTPYAAWPCVFIPPAIFPFLAAVFSRARTGGACKAGSRTLNMTTITVSPFLFLHRQSTSTIFGTVRLRRATTSGEGMRDGFRVHGDATANVKGTEHQLLGCTDHTVPSVWLTPGSFGPTRSAGHWHGP